MLTFISKALMHTRISISNVRSAKRTELAVDATCVYEKALQYQDSKLSKLVCNPLHIMLCSSHHCSIQGVDLCSLLAAYRVREPKTKPRMSGGLNLVAGSTCVCCA